MEMKRKPEMAGGTETILLVDDEPIILEVLQEMLTRFGYTTLAAESGEQAIEIFKKRPNGIDLIILDLSMPGMGGHACLKELLKTDPKPRVIIASGYSVNRKAKETLEWGAMGYIPKPYRHTDILMKIREVMEQTR